MVDIEVAGPHTIVVRSEVSGTPVHDFYGVKSSRRRFRVMAIDIHGVVDGKIARSYHVEDWATAVALVSVPEPAEQVHGQCSHGPQRTPTR